MASCDWGGVQGVAANPLLFGRDVCVPVGALAVVGLGMWLVVYEVG